MKLLLKLKHWQLFSLTWGAGFLMNIFAFSDPLLIIRLFPGVMVLFTIGTFGWVWAIATGLAEKLPPAADLDIKRFKLIFSIPVIYILLLCLGFGFIFYGGNQDILSSMGGLVAVIILLHFASMACIFYGIRFAAKTLKSAELGRPVKFSDYAGEFFLI